MLPILSTGVASFRRPSGGARIGDAVILPQVPISSGSLSQCRQHECQEAQALVVVLRDGVADP